MDKAAQHVHSFFGEFNRWFAEGLKGTGRTALTLSLNKEFAIALAKIPKKWSDQSSDGILSLPTFWKVRQMEFKTK